MWLIIIHLLLCVIFIAYKIVEKEKCAFPIAMVVCLPICGFIICVAEQIMINRSLVDKNEVGLEKLKVEDIKHRRVETDLSQNNDSLVPLEEAMIINDPKLRRSLMLDILHKNPEEYLQLLEKASGSDDVEITHYATTTLSEIQRDYEKNIQKCIRACKKEPENMECYRKYRDCLVNYIKSGLVDGVVLAMQRRNLIEVLEVLLRQDEFTGENVFYYVETAMDSGDFEEAEKVLLKYEDRCKEEIKWYQLAVRYYWESKNPYMIKEQLKKIDVNALYMTKEEKKWFEFWSRGLADEEKSN